MSEATALRNISHQDLPRRDKESLRTAKGNLEKFVSIFLDPPCAILGPFLMMFVQYERLLVEESKALEKAVGLDDHATPKVRLYYDRSHLLDLDFRPQDVQDALKTFRAMADSVTAVKEYVRRLPCQCMTWISESLCDGRPQFAEVSAELDEIGEPFAIQESFRRTGYKGTFVRTFIVKGII